MIEPNDDDAMKKAEAIIFNFKNKSVQNPVINPRGQNPFICGVRVAAESPPESPAERGAQRDPLKYDRFYTPQPHPLGRFYTPQPHPLGELEQNLFDR